MPAELIPAQPLAASAGRCRTIIAPHREGWTQLAMGEWELHADAPGHGDCHPHDEVNYVLAGLLVVECDGERVEAGPGDVVRVPANRPAFYSTPDQARMVFVYGANPEGLPAWTFTDHAVVESPTACS
jgi:quercetin dioxygenase-like cupin family protein